MPSRRSSTPGPKLLAEAVRAERKAQAITQKELAERAAIGVITVLNTEKGETRPRDFTLRALDRGLGWPPGTATAILDGAEPPPPGSGKPQPARSAGDDTSDISRQLAAITDRLARIDGKIDALISLVAANRGA